MPDHDCVTKAAGKTALRVPVSTYRLQLSRLFGFSDVKNILPYLRALGITDIYCSPFVKARPGSMHGYDIINHEKLNPEIGTEEGLSALGAELRRLGMGMILDIVPNHMCVLGENKWWKDVLENGKSSRYAQFFDIDWAPLKPSLKDKVILPILADQYGKVLESGELTLFFRDGAFFVRYHENDFPIEPRSYELILGHGLDRLEKQLSGSGDFMELMSILTAIGHMPPFTETNPGKMAERAREKEVIKKRLFALYENSPEVRHFVDENTGIINGAPGDPRSFDLFDDLLSRQPYRLSLWEVATDEINYRRFFDINELAAIKMEDPEVFYESHKLKLRLIAKGTVTGRRIDHVDGLYDPARYLRKLQHEALLSASGCPPPEGGRTEEGNGEENVTPGPDQPFYIVGEKILLKGERLPDGWPISGTTGYDFLNLLNGIFVKTENAKSLEAIYFRFMRGKVNFASLLYGEKKMIMETSMSGEINVLGHKISVLAEKNRKTRDFTTQSLTKAIMEAIACFPVYRTYISPLGTAEQDKKYIEQAMKKAKSMQPAVSPSVFDFLKSVLLLEYPDTLGAEEKAQWLDFVMRFQQHTSPVTAKGMEDTCFYVYNRLLSLNEVGGSPERFGFALEAFHGQNMERNKAWPCSMLATTTHDSKRSEDVRARINVISEMPARWKEAVSRWARLNARKKKGVSELRPSPDRNEEYHLYQTMAGIWPLGPDADWPQLKERLKNYMVKALREAKVNSNWINPDIEYEEALAHFIDAVLKPGEPFFREFAAFQKSVSFYGMLNSLSQVLLKIASPGVPDFYQGTDLWNFSLVDPDNRGQVDYVKRAALLEEIKKMQSRAGDEGLCKDLLKNMRDGKVKMFVTWKALHSRLRDPAVFIKGEYIPVDTEGQKGNNVCSFVRKNGRRVLAAAPRFVSELVAPEVLPLGLDVWGDTRLVLAEHGTFRNIFTGARLRTSEADSRPVLMVHDVFAGFPVALLEEVI